MKLRWTPSPVRALLPGAVALLALAAQAAPLPPAAQAVPARAGLANWQENGSAGRYVLQIIQGQAPKAGKRIVGVVTTDTDCDADAQGLSHCHNVVNLADGSQITVINSHNMHRNRCLGPGDQLTLAALDKAWVVGSLVKH